MARIVVIDTGVDRTVFPDIKGCAILPIDNGGYTVSDDFQDRIGHGTAICDIISKNCDAEIYMVRVYGEKHQTSSQMLTYALEYVRDNQQCDIVHISSGIQVVTSVKDLERLVNEVTAKGMLIVSAFDNAGSLSYPAVFDNVIGVDSDESLQKISDFILLNNSRINILGTRASFRVQWLNGQKVTQKGSSFTAAFISAQITKELSDIIRTHGEINSQTVIAKLSANATRVVDMEKWSPDMVGKSFLVGAKKAIVFPFAKEAHSLAAFENILVVSDVEYYDVRQSGRVGLAINKLLPHTDNTKTIGDFDKIDWTTDFDLFILGHCEVLNSLIGRNLNQEVFDLCKEYDKRLYSYDYVDIDDPIIYAPHINVKDVNSSNLGKLWQPHTPIVGIYGTSRKQGKHTLQMILKKKLENINYKVGFIGTEPSAYLFGSDFTYPMGYNNSVGIRGENSIIVLNEAVHMCEENEPDIIMTGSQSSTVTYANKHITLFGTNQHDFLLGTWPDYVILCVNIFDSIDYVIRTIRFIESAVDCTVGACAIIPTIKKEREFSNEGWEERYNNLKVQYERANIKLFRIDVDSEVEQMGMDMLNFFTRDAQPLPTIENVEAYCI
jgi:hypothetical protein